MTCVKLRGESLRTVVAVLMVPGLAAAQTAGTGSPAEAHDRAAPAEGLQQPGPAVPPVLDEIVVTAQRRVENLQDVPITVNAVSAQTLAAVGVTNAADLVNVIPGLTMPTTAGYILPHLRGIGITAVGAGIENSVALYVDGVYRGVASSDALAFNNIEQVEVEKGPQGTLFGRNATGGLIQVKTLDPAPGFSGSARVGYGNYNTVTYGGYLTGGVDMLAGDLAVQVTHQGEGYGTNLFNGEDVNRMDLNLSVRSKWLFEPTDGTKFTLILDEAETRNSLSALGNYQNAPNVYYPAGVTPVPPLDVNDSSQPTRIMKEDGASLQLDQDVGFTRIVNTVAYREDLYRYNVDFDLGPQPYSVNNVRQPDNQLTEELQLLSKDAGSLTWTLGAYYYNAHNGYRPQDLYFTGLAVNPAAPITHIDNQTQVSTDSRAFYGQATQSLTTNTRLTLGVRYTDEKRALVGLETGYLNGVIPRTLADVDTSFTIRRPTWRIALDHRFTDEVLGYVSYNRGIKSGGYNVPAPTVPAYRPETLDAYETGLKTELLQRRLTVNSAVFYYNYDNIQVARFVNGSQQVYNGGKARLYGLDVDATIKVVEGLTMSAGIELEHDEFTNFPNADFFLSCPHAYPTVCSLSANGKQLPQTPHASGTINLDYRAPVFGGAAHFNLNETANSGYYFAPNNEYRQAGYGLLNASAGWSHGGYDLSFWGKNLTDKIYPIAVNQAPTAVAAAYAPPRTYGVTLDVKF